MQLSPANLDVRILANYHMVELFLEEHHMKRLIVILLFLLNFTGLSQSQTPELPLILPFQEPPGIDTWLLGQAYGNTTGAYRFGDPH